MARRPFNLVRQLQRARYIASRHVLLFLGVLLGATGCRAATTITLTPTPTRSLQVRQGQAVFARECGSCHSTSAETVIVGPSLAGVATRAGARVPEQDARTYLYTAVMAPERYLVPGFTDLMPKNFAKSLTGEELDAVVAFLLTLQ